jgi:hypothetical protein
VLACSGGLEQCSDTAVLGLNNASTAVLGSTGASTQNCARSVLVLPWLGLTHASNLQHCGRNQCWYSNAGLERASIAVLGSTDASTRHDRRLDQC